MQIFIRTEAIFMDRSNFIAKQKQNNEHILRFAICFCCIINHLQSHQSLSVGLFSGVCIYMSGVCVYTYGHFIVTYVIKYISHMNDIHLWKKVE